MGQFLPPPFFSTFVLIGFRFTTQFRGIQLRATKTDAGIDVIHGLVKCLTQNEVPSPLPLYAFTHSGCSLARSRADPASPLLLLLLLLLHLSPPLLAPLSMLSSSILCLAKSSCKYEYMDHVSHFHVSASLSPSFSLSWWLLGGGGGFRRRCRRRCRCRQRCQQRPTNCVCGGSSSMGEREQLSARYFDGRRTERRPPSPSPPSSLHQP